MDWRFNTIWLEQLNQDTLLRVDFKEESLKTNDIELKKIEYAFVNHLNEKDKSLENFPKLIDFRFVDTKIGSGNLDILLEHPTLKSVGFIDKRNYNHKCEEINKQLKIRYQNNYKTYVRKGEFETFRYDFD